MSSPLYLERGHAVVGGHLFSPLPQKRVLGDSFMQESHILPCDRDAHIGSPLIRKVKDEETILTSSYVETDSVTSSCMLTSESFYGQTDSSILRIDNVFYSVENVKEVVDEATSQVKPEATPVSDSPSSKPRKRNVNWGDKNSITLSIEYPKSMAAECTPKTIEKVTNLSYFKICFGTEFSDEDEEDEDSEIECQSTEKDTASDVRRKDLDTSTTRLSDIKAKKPLIKVNFLSAAMSELLGVIETEDGMLSPQSLAKLSLSQIQLIVNDLLKQISQINVELMGELPKRDELLLEKEEKQAYLDRAAAETRFIWYTSPKRSYIAPFRPTNLDCADAFNPNPEYRYPFNSPPPRMSFDSRVGNCQVFASKAEAWTSTSTTVGSRLKTYINKFFNSRRSCQPNQPSFPDIANLKSMSF